MAKPSVKREELKTEIDKNQILELFVCEYSTEAIAKKLGCNITYVEKVLSDSLASFYRRNQEYAERAALMHLAKTRALTAKYMPIALEGSLQAAQFILKVIHTEQDILKDGLKEDSKASNAEDIQAFEQTLTSVDPRYAIALDNLTDDWMTSNFKEFEDIVSQIPQIQDNATIELAELHRVHHNLEESLLNEPDDSDL